MLLSSHNEFKRAGRGEGLGFRHDNGRLFCNAVKNMHWTYHPCDRVRNSYYILRGGVHRLGFFHTLILGAPGPRRRNGPLSNRRRERVRATTTPSRGGRPTVFCGKWEQSRAPAVLPAGRGELRARAGIYKPTRRWPDHSLRTAAR